MLPPLRGQRRLQRVSYFGAIARLQHLLPTLHEWYCHHPCKARFRLAGSPLRGSRTLWITTKGFRSLILLFWIYPGATANSSAVRNGRSRDRPRAQRALRSLSLAGGAQAFGGFPNSHCLRSTAYAISRALADAP